MSTDTREASEVSVTGLVTGILSDAQELAVRHLALFKTEVMESLRESRQAVTLVVVGVMLGQIGVLFLCQMCVVLLSRVFPELPLWGCYGIVGGLLLACGAYPLLSGIGRLRALDPSRAGSEGAGEERFQ